ncbi:MAG: urate hydroxylase PuuD [Gammaproteobacteria bacterium]|nr:urate hydroxylase PuuD [Gammaproteobacteria bacterium]
MNPLNSILGTIIAGFVLAAAIALGATEIGMRGSGAVVLWLHVMVGLTWIGLLYYFNFVQVPGLAQAASDEGGPGGAGISKYIAPRALLWFRWAALATWLTGATFLLERGQFMNAFTLGMGENGNLYGLEIGVGAWFGTIMLFNVWILIWPNQKKVLGMVEAGADEIAKAKRTAFLASRTNTMLSIPMLMSMLAPTHGFFL